MHLHNTLTHNPQQTNLSPEELRTQLRLFESALSNIRTFTERTRVNDGGVAREDPVQFDGVLYVLCCCVCV